MFMLRPPYSLRMRCYFLRHGLAGDPGRWQGPDAERPLTDEGRERMAREAKTIDELGLGLDAIVTSPLVRAKQTAQIVAERLKMNDRLIEDARVGLDFDASHLTSILADHSSASAIMLVGHDPSMSETIGALIGGGRVELKKGALACLDVPDPSAPHASLVWLAPPKLLAMGRR